MADTEKRTRPRVTVNAEATLQVLGTSHSGSGVPTAVQLVDASERGMRLEASVSIDAGVPVRLDIGDAMFLGEVCYCALMAAGPPTVFHIGIVTEECLSGLSGLRHLISAFERGESVDTGACLSSMLFFD